MVRLLVGTNESSSDVNGNNDVKGDNDRADDFGKWWLVYELVPAKLCPMVVVSFDPFPLHTR